MILVDGFFFLFVFQINDTTRWGCGNCVCYIHKLKNLTNTIWHKVCVFFFILNKYILHCLILIIKMYFLWFSPFPTFIISFLKAKYLYRKKIKTKKIYVRWRKVHVYTSVYITFICCFFLVVAVVFWEHKILCVTLSEQLKTKFYHVNANWNSFSYHIHIFAVFMVDTVSNLVISNIILSMCKRYNVT